MNTDSKSIPELIMLVGIPASGKSSITKKYSDLGYLILSSDLIRLSFIEEEKKYPTVQKELDRLNVKVFETIRKSAVAALKSGRSVVVDATNLNRKKRMAFLSNLGRTECYKKCVILIISRDVCLARNAAREGIERVPDEIMKDMLCRFECPGYWEGWDKIEPIIHGVEYRFPFEETVGFNQDNPYHSLSLHEHLKATQLYAIENGYEPYLQQVGYYHDIGKLYVKEFKNRMGVATDIAHYYGHENYGAYLYLTEMCCGKDIDDKAFEQILYNTNLINCHMRPLNIWLDFPKVKDKDIRLFGEGFVRDIELINKADRSAH